ncbi:hypothetical protein ACI77O_13000 [Pseudomonas tritici]|uniref:hypothetical protein n=1 Tax=Pseudomonas tritici TaxID=2745518 RepID=UPI00387AA615
MLAKLATSPDLVNADTDECVELLIVAYRMAGGSVDDLFSAIDKEKAEKAKIGDVGGAACEPDYGSLYDLPDTPVVALAPEAKKAVFLALKAQLQGKPAPF